MHRYAKVFLGHVEHYITPCLSIASIPLTTYIVGVHPNIITVFALLHLKKPVLYFFCLY